MNKLLIVLLAVCLVSVHAFVKRDAPATDNPVADIQKSLENIGKTISDAVQKVVNPDVIKEKLSEISKGIDTAVKAAVQPKPAA